MSHSSILGGDAAPTRASGRDTDSLGPSDSSDTGSDVQGERSMSTGADAPDELGGMPVDLGSDSDSGGTGERGAAAGDVSDGNDILPDHIVGDEAVDSDEAFDAGSSEGLDDIADDQDDNEEDEDDGGGAADAPKIGAGSAQLTGHRVFQVPAGTLDEPEGR